MARTKKDIFDRVKALLEAAQADGQTLEYVNKVFEGTPKNIMDPEFPCICLELGDSGEAPDKIPNGIRSKFRIEIIPKISVLELAAQITSEDANAPGMLKFVTDIMNVLDADEHLNDTCDFFHFPSVEPQLLDFPYRQATIIMEIDYLATKGNR